MSGSNASGTSGATSTGGPNGTTGTISPGGTSDPSETATLSSVDDAHAGQSASDDRTSTPLEAAKAPVSTGLVPLLGTLIAILVVAAGVVCVHDGLVHSGILNGPLWIDHAVTYLDGRHPRDWFYPVGVLLVLIGLLLVFLALRPRPRNEIPLKAQTGVFITKRSVQRLAQAAASNVDGIDTASTSASTSRVNVDVVSLSGETAEVQQRVESSVSRALSALEKPPAVKVRVTSAGGES